MKNRLLAFIESDPIRFEKVMNHFDEHIFHELVCPECKRTGAKVCSLRPSKLVDSKYGDMLFLWLKAEKFDLECFLESENKPLS